MQRRLNSSETILKLSYALKSASLASSTSVVMNTAGQVKQAQASSCTIQLAVSDCSGYIARHDLINPRTSDPLLEGMGA